MNGELKGQLCNILRGCVSICGKCRHPRQQGGEDGIVICVAFVNEDGLSSDARKC